MCSSGSTRRGFALLASEAPRCVARLFKRPSGRPPLSSNTNPFHIPTAANEGVGKQLPHPTSDTWIGSMDDKMPLLPLTVGKKKMASAYLDVVRLVSAWALFTASVFLVVFAVAYTLDHYNVPVPCSPLTDAGAAEVAAAESVTMGMLWCAAPQAAAAALALLLPCRHRRVRRALAYLALALTIGHIMYARASLHFYAADPGYLFAGIIYTLATVVFLAVDLLCFLALLLGRED